jgi:Ca2+-transporting ATPase
MNWHNLEIDQVIASTESSLQGLTSEVAKEKRNKFGLNQLIEKKKKSPLLLFLLQFRDFMILVLILAAIISGVVGDITDTIIILVIVLLNAIVGFVQEYKAEKAMEALKKMAAPASTVVRNNQVITIPSADLVPGDIVLLEAGDLVPADLRLLESHALRIEESSLTGESLPVDKSTEVIHDEDPPLGDRFNMAYKSTQITNGRGRGIVIATGMNTEIGKIAEMLQQPETMTPLQKRMADFGKKLSYLIIIICIILFVIGWLRGEEPIKMLLVAISLAVAAIPEALPALITIALARGAKQLVKKNALVRKLHAVETLGSVTFICSDKTGTLTQNKMKVVDTVPYSTATNEISELPLLEIGMALNHDVQRSGDGFTGDPTEIAIVQYLEERPPPVLKEILRQFPRAEELPFDSERKCMTTIHNYNGHYIAFSKGATESILSNLSEKSSNEEILNKVNKLSEDGIRVIAYAYRIMDSIPENLNYKEIEKDLDFLGLVGMIDPPREEAKIAIQECKTAGIKVVMITGDHKETASAVAKDIGILEPRDKVLSGQELAALSEEDFGENVERIRVYARVSPKQKLTIVTALQQKNHFVAMTGDGVNDAPALKRADIGIAMGITGTDVSKEASDMILLDDNFATIVNAVKEGRRIFDNIRKFVKYIMTCNGAEIWTIFLAPLLGLPIPLLPIHILWINLVTDGLPGLALSAEKAEKNIMQRPPRKTNESLFSEGIAYHIVWVGLLMAFLTLGIQAWAYHNHNPHWQTMVFTVLSLAQLSHVSAIRSDQEYIYKKGFFSNKPLAGAVILTFILQLAIIYLPVCNDLFKTQPLTISELLICIAVSALVFHAVELEKWTKKKKRRAA